MNTNYPRGFTLIELLVVIAIIGILAGIVLAALGNTRQKGADAGVQGNLDSIRTQAEISAGNNSNSYASVCTDPTVSNALTAAKSVSGATAINLTATAGSNTTVTCHNTATGWAADAPLKSVSGQNWCVDSSGFAGTTTGSGIGATTDVSCQ